MLDSLGLDVTSRELELVAGFLNRLDFVIWDRFVDVASELAVYGWIARPDGRFDFVILLFDPVSVDLAARGAPEDCAPGFFTSSAARSVQIATLLYGEAENDAPCQRVDGVFGDLVERTTSEGPGSRRGAPPGPGGEGRRGPQARMPMLPGRPRQRPPRGRLPDGVPMIQPHPHRLRSWRVRVWAEASTFPAILRRALRPTRRRDTP